MKYIIKVSNRETKKLMLTEDKVILADAMRLFKALALSLNTKLYEVSLELME